MYNFATERLIENEKRACGFDDYHKLTSMMLLSKMHLQLHLRLHFNVFSIC